MKILHWAVFSWATPGPGWVSGGPNMVAGAGSFWSGLAFAKYYPQIQISFGK